jgi:hypothetical protein
LAAHKELAKKIEKLEKVTKNNFNDIYELIRKYIAPTEEPKPKIGYRTDDKF